MNIKAIILESLEALSKERPLFYSEADFQLALGAKIKELHSELKIRMEYPIEIKSLPPEKSNMDKNGKVKQNHKLINGTWYLKSYLDMLIGYNGDYYPVELKYKTHQLECMCRNEQYNLAEHSAPDLNMYNMWIDVSRLERMKEERKDFKQGFAIWLTNDKHYFNPVDTKSNKYHLFSTQDTRIVKKGDNLHWIVDNNKPSKTDDWCFIQFENDHTVNWQKYSNLEELEYFNNLNPRIKDNTLFQYAIIDV